ncbi:MAG TPA: DUF932 domain-containing protein, partial [Fibrella sp.]
ATEPLATHEFEVGEGVAFRLGEDFNHGLKAMQANDLVNGFISIGGREFQLTRDALFEATSTAKMQKGFVNFHQSHIVEDALNSAFRGGLGKGDYKILSIRGNRAAALVREAVQPYSNLRMLEIMLDGVEKKYGKGEVFADYKFTHDLQRTHLRLIVPEHVRVIERTGTDNDTWSTGIQLVNSLTGLEQTQINGYLFRYWCTNGSIDTRSTANSVWSRRGALGQGDGVFEWARDAVDEVFETIDGSLDAVQAMTDIPIEGTAVEALRDVFTTNRVPTAQRNRITNNMINDGSPLTMYSLMQAVTEAANADDLSPADRDRLMRAGGALPVIANERCDSCHRFLDHAH